MKPTAAQKAYAYGYGALCAFVAFMCFAAMAGL